MSSIWKVSYYLGFFVFRFGSISFISFFLFSSFISIPGKSILSHAIESDNLTILLDLVKIPKIDLDRANKNGERPLYGSIVLSCFFFSVLFPVSGVSASCFL
jgi:hypothetical protein